MPPPHLRPVSANNNSTRLMGSPEGFSRGSEDAYDALARRERIVAGHVKLNFMAEPEAAAGAADRDDDDDRSSSAAAGAAARPRDAFYRDLLRRRDANAARAAQHALAEAQPQPPWTHNPPIAGGSSSFAGGGLFDHEYEYLHEEPSGVGDPRRGGRGSVAGSLHSYGHDMPPAAPVVSRIPLVREALAMQLEETRYHLSAASRPYSRPGSGRGGASTPDRGLSPERGPPRRGPPSTYGGSDVSFGGQPSPYSYRSGGYDGYGGGGAYYERDPYAPGGSGRPRGGRVPGPAPSPPRVAFMAQRPPSRSGSPLHSGSHSAHSHAHSHYHLPQQASYLHPYAAQPHSQSPHHARAHAGAARELQTVTPQLAAAGYARPSTPPRGSPLFYPVPAASGGGGGGAYYPHPYHAAGVPMGRGDAHMMAHPPQAPYGWPPVGAEQPPMPPSMQHSRLRSSFADLKRANDVLHRELVMLNAELAAQHSALAGSDGGVGAGAGAFAGAGAGFGPGFGAGAFAGPGGFPGAGGGGGGRGSYSSSIHQSGAGGGSGSGSFHAPPPFEPPLSRGSSGRGGFWPGGGPPPMAAAPAPGGLYASRPGSAGTSRGASPLPQRPLFGSRPASPMGSRLGSGYSAAAAPSGRGGPIVSQLVRDAISLQYHDTRMSLAGY